MSRDKLIKNAQIYLDRQPAIYLQGAKYIPVSKDIPLKEGVCAILIISLYCKTVYVDQYAGFSRRVKNYCDSSKRRSIGDIYRLVKYYENRYEETSNITLRNVYEAIDELVLSKRISTHICGDINKRVYTSSLFSKTHYPTDGLYSIRDKKYTDEFGNYLSSSIMRISEKKINIHVYTGGDRAIMTDFEEKTIAELQLEQSKANHEFAKSGKSKVATKSSVETMLGGSTRDIQLRAGKIEIDSEVAHGPIGSIRAYVDGSTREIISPGVVKWKIREKVEVKTSRGGEEVNDLPASASVIVSSTSDQFMAASALPMIGMNLEGTMYRAPNGGTVTIHQVRLGSVVRRLTGNGIGSGGYLLPSRIIPEPVEARQRPLTADGFDAAIEGLEAPEPSQFGGLTMSSHLGSVFNGGNPVAGEVALPDIDADIERLDRALVDFNEPVVDEPAIGTRTWRARYNAEPVSAPVTRSYRDRAVIPPAYRGAVLGRVRSNSTNLF